jgi:hypothetical protein
LCSCYVSEGGGSVRRLSQFKGSETKPPRLFEQRDLELFWFTSITTPRRAESLKVIHSRKLIGFPGKLFASFARPFAFFVAALSNFGLWFDNYRLVSFPRCGDSQGDYETGFIQ